MSNPELNYLVMAVECPSCREKQTVYLRALTGPAQLSEQTIKCVKCGFDFNVLAPGTIIGGPFGANF